MEDKNYQVEVPSMYSFSTDEEDYFEAGDSRRTTERLDLNSSFLIDRSKGFITFKNDRQKDQGKQWPENEIEHEMIEEELPKVESILDCIYGCKSFKIPYKK
jgi:hypothetical protein